MDVTQNGLPKNSPGTDAGPAIQSILSGYSSSVNVKLYFPAGDYYLKSNLDIERGNLWICGDGSNSTVIKIDVPTGNTSEFRIWPVPSTNSTMASGSYSRGDDEITVASSAGISVEDIVRISVPHDAIRKGQLGRVTAKSGNVLTVVPKLGIDMSNMEVRKADIVEDVKVSDIAFERVREAPIKTSNLVIRRVRNLLVESVESSGHAEAGIRLREVIDGVVTNCYVHDFKGPVQGSWGDGIMINDFSTNIHVTNNITDKERHGIWLGSSVSHCVVSYNKTISSLAYADMGEHHGLACHNNLFEGNDGFQMYSDIYRKSHHDTYYTAYFRNHAKTKIGFEKVDRFSEGLDNDHYNGMVVGNECPISTTMNVVTGTNTGILDDTVNGFFGANEVQGSMVWGALSASSDIPNSLVYDSKPFYVSAWPLYGPGSNSVPTEVIVDNADAEFSVLSGTWYTHTSVNDYGADYISNPGGSGADVARFTPDVSATGSYDVYAWWVSYTNRATNTPYVVNHANGSTTVRVDQQVDGAQWVYLGTFDFNQGTGGCIEVNDDANGGVVADAVKLTPSSSSIVVDNADSGFSVQSGTWYTHTSPNDYGANYLSNPGGSGADVARFTPDVSATDTYDVYAWWVSYTNRATNTPYVINHANGSTTVRVDQQVDGAQWVYLGTFDFNQGTGGYIEVNDDANGGVVADAVMLTPN